MNRKGKIGYHFQGEEARDSAPLRGPVARRDARPAAERRTHDYLHSTGFLEEPDFAPHCAPTIREKSKFGIR
jgi:hypothetical protein